MTTPDNIPPRKNPPQPPNAAESSAARKSPPVNPYQPPSVSSAPPVEAQLPIAGNFLSVRTGISVVFYGLNIIALGVLIAVGAVIANIYIPPEQAVFTTLLVSAAGIVMLTGSLFMFFGPFWCLNVPRKTGLRPYISISVLLSLASVVSTLIAIGTVFAGDGRFLANEDGAVALLPLLGSLLGIGGTVFFIIFLSKLATYLGHRKLTTIAVFATLSFLYIGVVPLVFMFVNLAVGTEARGVAPPITQLGGLSMFLAFLMPVAALIGLLTYSKLLQKLRQHLANPQFERR